MAIERPAIDAGYDLDLNVYRAGDWSPMASSTSTTFSRHEAAWVPDPSPGRYQVVITSKSVLGQAVLPGMLTPLRYHGAARLERGLTVDRTETDLGVPFTRVFVAFGKTAADATRLLPDLVPTIPAGFNVDPAGGAQYYLYGDRGIRHRASCYPQETLGMTADAPQAAVGPLRCLRWDQSVRVQPGRRSP